MYLRLLRHQRARNVVSAAVVPGQPRAVPVGVRLWDVLPAAPRPVRATVRSRSRTGYRLAERNRTCSTELNGEEGFIGFGLEETPAHRTRLQRASILLVLTLRTAVVAGMLAARSVPRSEPGSR